MPKEKKIFLDMPKMYRRQCIDHIMYGYVNGIRRAMPSINVRECIRMFLDDNELSEDDMALKTAEMTFYRMKDDYIL